MRSMNKGNIKTAWATIKHSRGRSALTIIGITVGVAAVILVVAIGNGVSSQLKVESGYLGENIVTIKPKNDGNLLQPVSSTLSTDDATAVKKVDGVNLVVPFASLSGKVSSSEKQDADFTVIATGPDIKSLLSGSLAYGSFYGGTDTTTSTAVIGRDVATELFNDTIPLGHTFNLKGRQFIVQGVLSHFSTSPLSVSTDLNKAIIIPLDVAATLPGNNLSVYQIVAQIKPNANQAKVMASIAGTMAKSHGDEVDFKVLAPGEQSDDGTSVINLLSRAIAGVAAISLLVGGIGIMNIMLVSVTERSQEIGIRKAVGATNQQILSQFLTEATLLSLIGGLIGISVAWAAIGATWVLTDFKPMASWQLTVLAFVVSVAIGMLFGSVSAAKAARKNPIDALRRIYM